LWEGINVPPIRKPINVKDIRKGMFIETLEVTTYPPPSDRMKDYALVLCTPKAKDDSIWGIWSCLHEHTFRGEKGTREHYEFLKHEAEQKRYALGENTFIDRIIEAWEITFFDEKEFIKYCEETEHK
jgi:hypothetical protein